MILGTQSMHLNHSNKVPSSEGNFSWGGWLALILSIGVGVFAAWWAVPQFATLLAQSLIGQEAKGFWFLSRASGVTGYVLLWASVVLGLLMSTRLSRRSMLSAWAPALMAVHEFVSWVAWGFVVFHAMILLGDTYVQTGWFNLLVPFAFDGGRSVWVGLGQMGFYLMSVVLVSYYVRQRIGFQTWRWLHFATFVLYALVTVHGLLAGSDVDVLWPMYALSNAVVLLLTGYRLVQMRQ
mgnify:CR=1 FL=1